MVRELAVHCGDGSGGRREKERWRKGEVDTETLYTIRTVAKRRAICLLQRKSHSETELREGGIWGMIMNWAIDDHTGSGSNR